MKALEIKNLRYGYNKEIDVVDGVSFDVNEGEYVSLIGHNGSGKSTIAKLIIGLLAKKSGKIIVFSEELNMKNLSLIRKKIGIVFQNPDNQFIGSTVRDDLAFGLENQCVKHEDMDGIINKFAEKTGMIDFLDKEPSHLSGGQKQRVAIAGVLAMSPSIVLFDEATSMLDPKGRLEIAQVIDAMRKENPKLTIISITHDIEETMKSDRVIVLNKGKVILSGSPNEIYEKEEKLRKIGLDVPFFYKIKNALLRENIDVSACHNLKDLEEYLCR